MVWFLLDSAPFPHPMPITDIIAIVVQLTIDGLGILGNVGVLSAIYYRAPANWSSYKILLINAAFVDLASSLASIMSIERMIPASFGTAFIFLGPCTLISALTCHTLHSISMNFQVHSVSLVPVSFAYRLHILKQ
ncbi:hypothetical protein PFISCL1PPCAC_12662, partial [Pristionchus fissidentatus]